jgi:hypothetical protein
VNVGLYGRPLPGESEPGDEQPNPALETMNRLYRETVSMVSIMASETVSDGFHAVSRWFPTVSIWFPKTVSWRFHTGLETVGWLRDFGHATLLDFLSR